MEVGYVDTAPVVAPSVGTSVPTERTQAAEAEREAEAAEHVRRQEEAAAREANAPERQEIESPDMGRMVDIRV